MKNAKWIIWSIVISSVIGLFFSTWNAHAAVSVVEDPTGFWKGDTFTLTINSAGSSDFGGDTCLAPKAWFYSTVVSNGFLPIWPDEVTDPTGDPLGVSISTSNTFHFTGVKKTAVSAIELYSYTPSGSCAVPVSKLNETWTEYSPTYDATAGDYYLWFTSIDDPAGNISTSTATSSTQIIQNPTQDIFAGFVLFFVMLWTIIQLFKMFRS